MASFDDDEIESIREIISVGASAAYMTELTGKLGELTEAQASACRLDIAQYKKIAYGTVKVKGGIKGTDHDTERDRLHVTNKMRLRLNYPLIQGYAGKDDFGVINLRIPGWSGSPNEFEN